MAKGQRWERGTRGRAEQEKNGGGKEQEGNKDRKRKRSKHRAKGMRLLNLYALPPLQSCFTLVSSLISNFHPATACYLDLPHGDVPHFYAFRPLLYSSAMWRHPNLNLLGVLIPLTSPVCGIAPCLPPSPSLASHLGYAATYDTTLLPPPGLF